MGYHVESCKALPPYGLIKTTHFIPADGGRTNGHSAERGAFHPSRTGESLWTDIYAGSCRVNGR